MLKKTYLVDETPGSISNIYEIRILICCILKELEKQITAKQLYTVFQMNYTVNYFNFCQAIKELLNENQLQETKNEDNEIFLAITNAGKEIATSLKNNIAKATLEKTIKNMKQFLMEEHENKNKKIYTQTKDDGYSVKLTLEEINSNLMDLELFCPNLKIAENFKKQMKLKTTEIYTAILAIINNDHNTLYKIASKLKQDTWSFYHIIFNCQF